MTDAERFSTHEEPVWRERANFIINAKLPEDGRFEQLWTRKLSDDTFEVCCIPFFVYDVALGDVVRTAACGERRFVLDSVLRRSGRYTFRVWFGQSFQPRDEIAGEQERVDHVGSNHSELRKLGSLLEWSSRICSRSVPIMRSALRTSCTNGSYARSCSMRRVVSAEDQVTANYSILCLRQRS